MARLRCQVEVAYLPGATPRVRSSCSRRLLPLTFGLIYNDECTRQAYQTYLGRKSHEEVSSHFGVQFCTYITVHLAFWIAPKKRLIRLF